MMSETYAARQAFVMRERRNPSLDELEQERVRRAWADIHRRQMERPSLRPNR